MNILLLDSRPFGEIQRAYFAAAIDVQRLLRIKHQLEIRLLSCQLRRELAMEARGK